MPRINFKSNVTRIVLAVLALGALVAGPLVAGAVADTRASVTVEFTDTGLAQDTIKVAAGEVLTLVIKNASQTPIEFESPRLHLEKIVKPGDSVELTLNRLAKGSYPFFDEFHEDKARGEIVAE